MSDSGRVHSVAQELKFFVAKVASLKFADNLSPESVREVDSRASAIRKNPFDCVLARYVQPNRQRFYRWEDKTVWSVVIS